MRLNVRYHVKMCEQLRSYISDKIPDRMSQKCQITCQKMAIEIVDIPMKNGDFP